MTTNQAPYVYKEVPLYAKTLIIVQTLVILFLSFWFYQEYTYNTFFQTWLNGFIQTNQLLLLTTFTGLTFAAIAVGVLVRIHTAKANLASATAFKEASAPKESGILPVGAEQHLIDMIRRNASSQPSSSPATSQAPAQTSPGTIAPSGQGMPTLQRRDPNQPNPP